jgi:hypothetical protein
MFTTILVAVDQSPGAATVLPFARALAARCHAGLRVLPIEEPALPGAAGSPWSVRPSDRHPATDSLHGESPAWLDAAIGSYHDESTLVVTTSPVRSSDSSLSVTQCLDAFRAPVLALPGGEAPGLLCTSGRTPRLLVVLDQSTSDDVLLSPVISLAHATGGHVTLVSVGGEGSRSKARLAYLDRVADQLRAKGLSVASRVTGNIPQVVELAKGSTLVAVASETMSGDGPSLATALIDLAVRPVLTVSGG